MFRKLAIIALTVVSLNTVIPGVVPAAVSAPRAVSGSLSIVEGPGPFTVGQVLHFEVSWSGNIIGSHDPWVEVLIDGDEAATRYSYDVPFSAPVVAVGSGRAVLVYFNPQGKTGSRVVLASSSTFVVD